MPGGERSRVSSSTSNPFSQCEQTLPVMLNVETLALIAELSLSFRRPDVYKESYQIHELATGMEGVMNENLRPVVRRLVMFE